MMKTVLTGNHAVALAVKFSGVRFIAAYPITPQTSIVERLAYFVENGQMNAKFVNTESEHSALAMAYGAALGGVRSFTATSSHGLLYMHEWLHWVSRSRIPLVMAVVTRTIGPPWNIWPDHSDYMDQRDAGWIMLFASDSQEAFDMTVQSFRISEDERVFIPVIVGLDGFIVSGTSMPVVLPEEREIKEWVGERKQPYFFDGSMSITLGNLTYPEDTYRLFKELHKDLENSIHVIKELEKDYVKKFDNSYKGPVEVHGTCSSKYAAISMGAWSDDMKEAVKALREEGIEVSHYRLRVYRPFPCEELKEMIGRKRGIIVFDRSISFGGFGPLYADVKSCVYKNADYVIGVVGGLGGVNHDVDEFKTVMKNVVLSIENEKVSQDVMWMEEWL